jgi:hypothetical protein
MGKKKREKAIEIRFFNGFSRFFFVFEVHTGGIFSSSEANNKQHTAIFDE